MKPQHVRYGHTPHSTPAAGGRGLYQQFRRPSGGGGGGEDGVDGSAMIEEYKLEEQLAPFYGETASSSNRGCYLPGSTTNSSSVSSSTTGVKPALRTVSIMETLSELTNNARAEGPVGRRPPPPDIKSSGEQNVMKTSVPVVKRKKTPQAIESNMASLLDIPQLYPKRPERPMNTAVSSTVVANPHRVWDVSRLVGSKLNNMPNTVGKGRSVEHILTSPNSRNHPFGEPAVSPGSAHGYGSLERRRRRRPGNRAGLSTRRGETDWEREEDEEDDDERRMAEAAVQHLTVPGALFQQPRSRKPLSSSSTSVDPTGERERSRQSYKPPTEWFKKKRPQHQLHHPAMAGNNNNANSHNNNKTSSDIKERGQTPDWIHKIFHVARRGNLLKLQRVVAGMEPTLVRNLSDHRGNNLLHVLAGAGNADAMAWLCSSFGPEMQDALLDENKHGLTPVVAAIQAGRLEALQFLVDHTSARERLAPIDGDRSLLHIAAKYGKIDLVAWLAQYMESHGFEIDLRDHSGHTPLHLAARAGQASAVAILVAHGADVTAKNDMGHRPLDLASASGHVGVAQLLRLHDAALCLSAETLDANEELESLRTDYAELKSHFRDVLVIGKRFAKERDEMCRQLGRLYEDVTSLHQALLFELRTAHRDLASVRDRTGASRKAGEIADRNLDESVAVVESLHDKWQNQQRGWFSSNLADMEHRLLVAEDGWKRLRTSSGTKHRTCQIRPHELLRSRLAAVNAQASNIQCDVTAFSSSEGSLYSACCQSGGSEAETDDQLNQTMDTYHHLGFPQKSNSGPTSSSSWYGNSTKSPARSGGGGVVVTKSTPHGRSATESADSVYSTLQAAVRKMSTPEREVVKETIQPVLISHNKKQHSKQELRKRLQEVKLTSESGNASVIEVIEPSSSEEEEGPIRPPRDQSTPLRSGGHARSFNASFSEELEKARQSKNRLTTIADGHSKSTDPLNKILAEPDLLAGTVVTASSRSCHDLALEPLEDEVNPSSRSHSSLSSSNNTAITSVPRKKSGGFLTKFALKARWPSSKRKATPESLSTPETVTDNGMEEDGIHQEDDISPGASNTSGVVAGLSQMFEDMSSVSMMSIKSSSGMMEKRGSHSPSVRAPSIHHTGDQTNSHPSGIEEPMEDLPPSTSPPPVPLEIETYNSMSPSSSQQETSSSSVTSHTTSSSMPPPPPPRCTELTKVTPSSSASSSTSASHGGVESLSVAASEDSGIVMARPASSASKSGSSPRLAPSTAATYSFTTFSPLRCKNNTTVLDTSGERLSPAPSDISKTESTSALDLSKTESMRHFRQLARIEETAAASIATTEEHQKPAVAQDLVTVPKGDSVVDLSAHQSSGQILTWREAKLKNQVVTPPPLEERLNKARVRLEEKSIRTLKKRHHVSERPWYDVSDDESDLLTPERLLTNIKTSLSSSDTTSASSSEEDVEV